MVLPLICATEFKYERDLACRKDHIFLLTMIVGLQFHGLACFGCIKECSQNVTFFLFPMAELFKRG